MNRQTTHLRKVLQTDFRHHVHALRGFGEIFSQDNTPDLKLVKLDGEVCVFSCRMFAESITDTSQKHSKLLEVCFQCCATIILSFTIFPHCECLVSVFQVSSILQNALLHTKSQTTQILAFIGSNQVILVFSV